jgi:hypothetical protein
MKDNQHEIREEVEKYVWKRFRIYIEKDGETIRFGKATFPIEMLVNGSISVFQANPEKDIFEIVDLMFDYYCT